MKIYLAGSIPKGDKEAEGTVDWRKRYAEAIKLKVKKADFFDPRLFNSIEGDSRAVAGADCWCIQKCDLIIVNAEEKLGAGTAMELVIAKYFNKPVITVLPKNSHHRRNNLTFEGKIIQEWIHPFIETFSDIIIENPLQIKQAFTKLKKIKIKNITVIDESIKYAQKLLASPRH